MPFGGEPSLQSAIAENRLEPPKPADGFAVDRLKDGDTETFRLYLDTTLRRNRPPTKPVPSRSRLDGSGVVPAALIETASNPTSYCWFVTENCSVPEVASARNVN